MVGLFDMRTLHLKLSVEDEKHEGATLSFKNELDDEKQSTTLMHFIMKSLFCTRLKDIIKDKAIYYLHTIESKQ